MGIVGYGRIGQAVGRMAQAFGMKILATSRTKKNVPEGVRFTDFETVLKESDVISFHCPLTAENTEMINRESIKKMKDGVIVLNTARGQLINEEALAEALRAGKVCAAGLDVVSEEPAKRGNPLFSAPNCIITPHIAWASKESRERLMNTAVDNLKCFLAGKPVNVVNGV